MSNLSESQEKVLNFFKNTDIPTQNRVVSVETGIPISSVSARVYELRKLGELAEIGRIKDQQTGRTVRTWARF